MDGLPSGAIASIGSRFGARFIDALVIGIPMTALVLSQSTIDIDARVFDTPGWIPWLGASLGFVYEVVCVAWRGQTVGKALVRIRIVELGSLDVPSLGHALRRAIPYLLTPLPIVGSIVALTYWLPVLWRSDRRGSHDLIAGTGVISADY